MKTTIKLLLIVTFGLGLVAERLKAQTLVWTYSIPVPTNYLVGSYLPPKSADELLHKYDNDCSGYGEKDSAANFCAGDGRGGSVWLLQLVPRNDLFNIVNTNPPFIRVTWLNNKGIPLYTNDIVQPIRSDIDPDIYTDYTGFVRRAVQEAGVGIARFTKNELALQIVSTPIGHSGNGTYCATGVGYSSYFYSQGATNVCRRIKKSGSSFVLKDAPLSLNERMPLEHQLTTDAFGLFTYEDFSFLNVPASPYGANIPYNFHPTIRRYSNK